VPTPLLTKEGLGVVVRTPLLTKEGLGVVVRTPLLTKEGLGVVVLIITPNYQLTTTDQHLFDFRNRFPWIQIFGTSVGAIHNRVTTVESERVL